MKKLIALALAVMLLASMAVSVSAESTTTLTATVPAASYTLNIPANQEIPFGTTKVSIGNITVADAQGFAEGKNLDITIAYDAFSAEGISTKIPYTLNLFAEGKGQYAPNATLDIPSGTTVTFKGNPDGTTKTAVVLETAAEFLSATDLYLNATNEDWGKALAGEYTSTITFTAEVVVEG